MRRRRRSTRSVIKLLAAAAVATASIVSLGRLSTPPAKLPLAFCDDIEEIDTKVLAQPPRRGNAPEQLMDFLRTYKNEHRPGDDDDDDDEKVFFPQPGAVAAGLDTYAGEWYSRDAGGTFVLAFTDDPKPHLEAIRRRRPPGTGDWPVDVVRAPHTKSELKAAEKKVDKMFERLRGRPNLKSYAYASDPQRSRVEIDVSGYTFEDMAAMANALDDEAHGKVCLWGRPQIRVPTLEDRLKERFAPMADAVDADSKPVGVWLRNSDGYGGRQGLRLALPKGLGTVEMRLDRTNPPDPDSTTLHLLVRQSGCGSGRSGVERMPKPEVIESATEIRIAMGVIPPDGAVACPGHPLDPIKIELAAPIGRRKILDGLILPPEPLEFMRLRRGSRRELDDASTRRDDAVRRRRLAQGATPKRGLPRLRPHRRDAVTSPGLPLDLCQDIVPTSYSHAELTEAQQRVSSMMRQFFERKNDDTLMAGWYVGGSNRVQIDITCPGHPTVEEISAMADALDDEFHGMVCVEGPLWDGSIRLPTVDDRFAPMADAGANPLVECDDDERVPDSKYTGDCGDAQEVRLVLPDFIGEVEMQFDRRNPPDSDSTTLHLLVTQKACASGRSGVERMLKPEVIESATEIRVAMGVIAGCGGRCPGNPFVPITIKLAAPIGQRKIVDGLFLPPRPLWPKSLRIARPYRRNLVIYALTFALAVLAMARAAMAVRRWRRANAEVRLWRRARDHAS